MLTDKQTLLLCTFIVLGFVIGGVFDVLDNYVTLGVIIMLILIVLLNIIFHKILNNKDK